MKVTQKHEDMLNKVCKAFKFTDLNDTNTVITSAEAKEAGKLLKKFKADILDLYP